MSRVVVKEKGIELLTDIPRLMLYTSLSWFLAGGASGLIMILANLIGVISIESYYQLMTFHGVIMVFGGLFQLMMSLSLLRTGICYGKPVKRLLTFLSYIVLNGGLVLILLSIIGGVSVSYTLMFPLPAVGVFKRLWSMEALTTFIWGIILVLIVVVALYPASLSRLLFTGKPVKELMLAKYMGTLNPSGMAGMLRYIFILPPLSVAITAAAILIGLALLGVIPLNGIPWFTEPVNFNYSFWIWAHNLMEVMGIMAIGTVYWIIPRYSAVEREKPTLYSERLGLFAILFYSSAAIMAFPHHLFTMPTTQPIGLSYTGQIASWLTGFGAAFSVFNIAATMWVFGFRLTPASLATFLGFLLYVTDGFLAMQLGTIGWAYRLHGTYYVTAHLMTILLAVTLIWIGAFYDAHQLMIGRRMSDKLSYPHIILTALSGFGLMYLMAYMGVLGVPRRTYPWPIDIGAAAPALMLMGVILAAAQIIFLVNLARSKIYVRHEA